MDDGLPRSRFARAGRAIAVTAVLITLLTAGAMLARYLTERSNEAARIEAIAAMRAADVAHWLADRMRESRFLVTSQAIAEQYLRWHDQGDAASGQHLLEQLVEVRRSAGQRSVLVLDESGAVVAAEAGVEPGTPAELRAAGLRSLGSGAVERTDLYGHGGPAPAPRIDIVIPLAGTGRPARAAVVVRIDPRDQLLASLGSGPVPGTSADSLLFVRSGSDLREAAGGTALPIETAGLLVGRVARGEMPPGVAFEGDDFDGRPVLGAVRPVEGTGWLLATRTPRAEVLADAAGDMALIAATGLLALIAAAFAIVRLGDVMALRDLRVREAAQGERLHGLQLLDRIAAQSTDVIFAKDLEGRYLFFNREAGRVYGRAPAEVLGRTARELVPEREAQETMQGDALVVAEDRTVQCEERLTTASGLRTFLVTKGPLHDENGVVVGVFGISHDITEREQSEQARERLAAIVASSGDAIFAKTLDGVITSWNHGAEQLFGHRSEEAVGRNATELLPGPRAERLLERVASGEQVAMARTTRLHRDGRELDLSITVSPVRDAEGRVIAASEIVRDVSERVRLERLLREREAVLQRAQVMARLAHVAAAADGTIESLSDTLADILKRPPETMPRRVRDWLAWIHPDDRERVRSELAAIGSEPKPAEFEYRVARGDGEWIVIEHATAPLDPAGTGREVRWFGTLQDVTEQRRAQARLREAAEFVQAVEDSVLDHMAVLDRAGTIVAVNAAWREHALRNAAAGCDGDDHVGAHYHAACAQDGKSSADTAAVEEGLRAVLAGESDVFRLECGCRAGDEERWFSVNVTPLRTAGGGAVVVHTDITERKRNEVELSRHRHHLSELVAERSADLVRANHALTAAEQFLRTIADNLPGRVAYWTAETICGFANKTFCARYDMTQEQLIGHTMVEIFGADTFAEREARVRAVLAGEAQHFERDERTLQGEWERIWIHYIPDRGEDGRVRGFFVLGHDITEIKKTELELQLLNRQLVDARDRAEASTRAKSAFLANMSHEIRTPMNAIIGMTHLLQRDVREPVHLDRLGKVSDAAHHLLGVINDILDLSKIESGKLKLEQADFAVDALLSRVFSLVAEKARDKGIELVINTDHLPRVLHGDATRLAQALLNLLSNAVKFTERGSVTLSGALLGSEDGRLHVRFAVADTGIGIPADRIGALFNAFEQADTSTTRRYGGTGLGLSITRQLAELMGGEAGAESTSGVGSRFWFTVRLRPALQPAVTVAAAPLKGRRALLADDRPEAREALAQMLRQFGLRIDVAESGEQAVALAAAAGADPYELAVLDWKMPGIDGIETLRRLREASGGGAAPRCVLVSACDTDDLRPLAEAAGIGAVLVKPVSLSALHDALVGSVAGTRPAVRVDARGQALRTLQATRAGARVLLAEDNAVNQEVAIELLRSAGLEVVVAGDGEQAVARAGEGGFDLVLMDVQMPRLDGLQATRAIRALPGRAALPIVAMTANAFGDDRVACLAAGMNDHVAKPVEPDRLYESLLRWLPARLAGPACREPPAPPELPAPPAPPAGNDSLARLAGVEGLDVAWGLQSFGGAADIYLRVVDRFVAVYRQGMPQLDDAITTVDAPALAAAAHSLRGAAASIGATRVDELARQLETQGKQGGPTDALADVAVALRLAVAALVARLGAARGSAPH